MTLDEMNADKDSFTLFGPIGTLPLDKAEVSLVDLDATHATIHVSEWSHT